MEATRLTEQHEQDGTSAHNGKQISATDVERVHELPSAPTSLWPAGKERLAAQSVSGRLGIPPEWKMNGDLPLIMQIFIA